jgi:hypothetical protein
MPIHNLQQGFEEKVNKRRTGRVNLSKHCHPTFERKCLSVEGELSQCCHHTMNPSRD